MTPDQQLAIFRSALCKRSFYDFIRLVRPGYEFNWHHLELIEAMQRLADRKMSRLIVQMPPRHGKSEIVSRLFPAWLLARNPDEQIIACSYAADLAEKMSRDCQRIMTSPRYTNIFPEIGIGETREVGVVRTNKRFDIPGHKGYYVSAGVSGAITGEGCTVGIIDDPVKNPLSIDTPIPTPDGWKKMGELRVGDLVFDEMGNPVSVTFVSQRWNAKRNRVVFSDHSHIDAHPDHRWCAFDRKSHSVYTNGHSEYSTGWHEWKNKRNSKCSIVTTSEMAQTLRHKSMRNWTIPTAKPIQVGKKNLLIAPYVLGLWLGDGGRGTPAITSHIDDVPFYEGAISAVGYYSRVRLVSKSAQIGSPGTRVVAISLKNGGSTPSHTEDSIPKRLRSIGVWMNKHIPKNYLRSSKDDRVALLRGLMDADGTAGEQSVFCNKNEDLVDGVVELVASLGGKATKFAKENDFGTYWIVSVCTSFCPFALPRKIESWYGQGGKPSIRRLNRTVDCVVEIDEMVEYVCIGVDSNSHLFLAGKAMIPTHNSEEADSPTYRERAWNWYRSTFKTRFEPGAVEVICQTRWHENDLAGRIIKDSAERGGEGTEIISFPALCMEAEYGRDIGEALWEGKYDRAALLKIQQDVGSRSWNALYQQRPSPDEGTDLKKSWFQYYDPRTFVIPPTARVNFFFDTAYTDKDKNDPTAGIAYVKIGADFYILSCLSKWVEFTEAIQFIKTFAADNFYTPRSIIRIEPKASGKSVVQVMKKQTALNITDALLPKESKQARVRSISPTVEGGRVFLPSGAAWVDDFLSECAAFPNAAHDDRVDCLTGMILNESTGRVRRSS